jgi:hypothetical protein
MQFHNNLFWQSVMTVNNQSTNAWVFQNNFFDRVSFVTNAGPANGNYNGYVTGHTRLTVGANDVVLTLPLAFEKADLGDYYQPASSGLINKGSQSATNLGLYHYTTTTNQVKETNSLVDIGFHYIATVNGLPSDMDNDGLADYLEDANGDGIKQASETNVNSGDSDGDGVNDYVEWLLGRNPLQPLATANDLNQSFKVFTPLY